MPRKRRTITRRDLASIANGGQIDYYLLGLFDQPNSAPLEPVHRFLQWHAANGEQLTGTRSLARVALYHSNASEVHAKATRTGSVRNNAFRGAYRLLLEGRVPFDFISDERMADDDAASLLAGYDVIILSDVACLSDREATELDAGSQQGGTLIATGEQDCTTNGARRERYALQCFPASRLIEAEAELETSVAVASDELDFPETRLLHLDGWFFHAEAKADATGSLALLPTPDYGPPELCFAEAPRSRGPTRFRAAMERAARSTCHGCPNGSISATAWRNIARFCSSSSPRHRRRSCASKVPGRWKSRFGRSPAQRANLIVHLVNYSGQRQSAYDEPPALHGLRLGVRCDIFSGRALVSGLAVEHGPADEQGYVWLEVPPVKYFEAIMLRSIE